MISKASVFPRIVGCPCFGSEYADACVCSADEKVLRAYTQPTHWHLPAMSDAQREWCETEIRSVEGHDTDELRGLSDADLASEVLHAWQDYCRDKGLI